MQLIPTQCSATQELVFLSGTRYTADYYPCSPCLHDDLGSLGTLYTYISHGWGDWPGPRKETTTRQNVTQGGEGPTTQSGNDMYAPAGAPDTGDAKPASTLPNPLPPSPTLQPPSRTQPIGGERLLAAFKEALIFWHPDNWVTRSDEERSYAARGIVAAWQAYTTLNEYKRQKIWESRVELEQSLRTAPHLRKAWIWETSRVPNPETNALTESLVQQVPNCASESA